jgi:hypothetical protein
MRDELLNETLFFGLDHARSVIAAWVAGYNAARPHSALGCQTPSTPCVDPTPPNSPQRAIGSTKRRRSANRPLLPPRKQAILTRRLWFQVDERRGSEQKKLVLTERLNEGAEPVRVGIEEIDNAANRGADWVVGCKCPAEL